MIKNKWYLALIAIQSFHVYAADDCAVLHGQLEQAMSRADYNAAFAHAMCLENEYCFNNELQSRAQQKSIARAWGDALFNRIFGREQVSLGQKQTERLLQIQDEVDQAYNAVQPVDHNTTCGDGKNIHIDNRDAWQIAFLQLILEMNRTPQKALLNGERYQRLNQILLGYLDDAQSGNLLPAVAQMEVDEFIKQLQDAGKLSIEPEEMIQVSMRSGGQQNAVNQLLTYRGGMMSSSERQPAIGVTPIRFHYDSTRLNEQGVQEYQDNLPILKAGTNKSILLIGHTDPKGNADYNCWLSQCRVLALRERLIKDGVSEDMIEVAWAGENIALEFSHAGEFMRQRDVQITPFNASDDAPDPMRRRVQYEINGKTLLTKYRGQFCQLTDAYRARPCDK